MNTIISISILILSISVAIAAIGFVAYVFDLDDLFRQIRIRMKNNSAKVKKEEYERGRALGRKEFATEIDRLLEVYLYGNNTKYTYQVKNKLEKKIAEEVRK